MAIGGSDSALQTQLKNLYTSNLDPNIVKNTPTSLPKAKPITQMVYEGATEDNPYGTGRRISQQVDIGPDFSGLTPDRNAVGGEETVTYRKPVSPYIDAVYNDSGKLTGYEANNNAYLTNNSYVHGSFDVNGVAHPVYQTKSAGGFFQGQLPAMVALAAGAYGLPGVGDALGPASSFGDIGLGATDASLGAAGQANAAANAAAAAGASATPLSQISNTLSNIKTFAPGELGSGTFNPLGDVTSSVLTPSAAQVGQLTGGAPLTSGAFNTAATGALGAGLGGAATDAMGTIIPAAGGAAAGTSAAAIASGAVPAGITADAAAAAAAAKAAGGTALTDLITPSTALIGKAILDTVGSNKTVAGINSAAATQQAAYEQSKKDLAGLYANQQGYQRPYMATGTNALSNLGALGTGTYQMYDEQGNPTGTGTGSGYLQHQFDASDLAKGLAPNYDFMLQQGQMANQRAANMAGGGFGGNALQGLNRYTQDYAGNAYQQAFNNYQTQRQNIFGDLTKLADVGQGAANQLTGATGNYGTNLTNLNVGNAAAQAAAQVAAAQQGGTNLSNVGNTAVAAALLNQNPSIAKVNLNV